MLKCVYVCSFGASKLSHILCLTPNRTYLKDEDDNSMKMYEPLVHYSMYSYFEYEMA